MSEQNETRATRPRPRVLDRAEMPVDTAELARFLIGKMLVRKLAEGAAGGRIVETEAYTIGDPAGHAYRGVTPRNRALFLERGHAYVYLAYGVSFMLNVSSGSSAQESGGWPPLCRLGFSASARPIEHAKVPAQTDRRNIGSRELPSRL